MTRWTLFRKNVVLVLRHHAARRRRLWVAGWMLWSIGGLTWFISVWEVPLVTALLWAVLTTQGLAALIVWSTSTRLTRNQAVRVSAGSQEHASHRPAIAQELLRVAALVDRAGCELMCRQGVLPEQHRGISRRRTLDLARREDLWPGFSPAEQELLLSPEGSWPDELAWQTTARNEDVRVLRFVVGLDGILTPFEFLEQDLQIALELTSLPAKVDLANICLAPMDLRPGQGVADAMLARCLVEGSERELFDVGAANVASLRRAGRARDDSLWSVSQGQDSFVHWIGLAAYRRVRTFAQVIAFLYSSPEDAARFRIERLGHDDEADEM